MIRRNIGLILGILILIIIILLGILAYTFLIKPVYAGYVVDLQTQGATQGVEFTILTIMQQASTCQPVPLTAGNQTMNLVWVDCLTVATQEPTG